MPAGAADVRVLVGMPFPEPHGGSERLLLELLERAGAEGLDPHVVFLAPGRMIEEARARGARTSLVHVRRPNHPLDAARAVTALRGVLAADRPDVVLSWHSRAHLYLGLAARLSARRVPVAWWQHHLPGRERLERAATAVPADLVVATSRAAAERQRALRPRRRCVVVNPGVAEPDPSHAAAGAELRAGLGLGEDAALVGIVGRLVRWKGQHRFLEAIALLRERGHDVAAVVVGGTTHGLEPEYAPYLRRRAAELGLEAHVRFTGHVDDPLSWIAALDVLVNASEAEPFGMTLLEAMALRVPVVAVAAGGPVEIVEPGVSGALARDPSPAALADAIEPLLDRDRARRLAEAGRERYERRFTAERFAAEAARVIRELAAAGRRAR